MSDHEQDEFTTVSDNGSDSDCRISEGFQSRDTVLCDSGRTDNVQLDKAETPKKVGADVRIDRVKRGRAAAKKHPKRNGPSRVRSRAWVGTLNNPTPANIEYYRTVGLDKMTWIVVGEEKGESGTHHLQMACRFNNQVDMSTASRVFGQSKSHIEVMKGHPDQSKTYCSKEKLIIERGVMPVREGRQAKAKLDGMVAMLKKGASDKELFESNPAMWLRYRSSLSAAKQLYAGEVKRNKVSVYWYWGETGAGKSFRSEQEAEKDGRALYRQNGSSWWDGYDGQPLVIIDDFAETANFRDTLRILDVYNTLVPTKGSHAWLKAEKIWITASYHPSKIDNGGQIERRCELIIEMRKKDRPDIMSMLKAMPSAEVNDLSVL